jgi:hypothetical protein
MLHPKLIDKATFCVPADDPTEVLPCNRPGRVIKPGRIHPPAEHRAEIDHRIMACGRLHEVFNKWVDLTEVPAGLALGGGVRQRV